MRLSLEELTANIDDDFKAVVEKLQKTFNFMAANLQHGRATHTYGAVAKVAMEGIKITYISAGKYKVDGNETEPLSKEALARIQSPGEG